MLWNSGIKRMLLLILSITLYGCSTPKPIKNSYYFQNKHSRKIVVFVHGVLGDVDTTWLEPNINTYWPKILAADSDFKTYDVYLVSYASPLRGTASTIEQIAQRELQGLLDNGVFQNDEIYFICHSMGGLITKRMLIELNRAPTLNLLSKVKGVVFLSTPAQGSELATIANWLSLNPQFRDMEPSTFNVFLQSIENQWQRLLSDRDQRNDKYPKAYCAYETQPMGGVLVVSSLYATTRCDNIPIAFDLNHSQICKPRDTNSDPYPWTKNRILEASNSIPSIPLVQLNRSTEIREPKVEDDDSLTPSNIVDAFTDLGYIDFLVIKDMQFILNPLLENGINTKRKLNSFLNDKLVMGTLKLIYIDELKRPRDFPLDPVAISLYGSYLYKHKCSAESIEVIRRTVRTSYEYASVWKKNMSLNDKIKSFEDEYSKIDMCLEKQGDVEYMSSYRKAVSRFQEIYDLASELRDESALRWYNDRNCNGMHFVRP